MKESPKTSREWWSSIKDDEKKLIDWLQKQYYGENTAAERIEQYCLSRLEKDDSRRSVLLEIGSQEKAHASWIYNLLANRGVKPTIKEKQEHYWEKTLPTITSFEESAGVAYHAETMRLERIRVIAGDEDAPKDIRFVFNNILRDELFHQEAFLRLAGEDAISKTSEAHKDGAKEIGFITAAETL
jgi:rubrerythrin